MTLNRLYLMVATLLIAAVVSACGTVATPDWQVADAGEAEAAEAVEEGNALEELEVEPTVAPTSTPPPPTATPTLVPTNTPMPEPTATVAPTEQPTEEDVTEANGDVVAQAIAMGDLENGQTIFNATYNTSSGPWICASCHSVDESQLRLVGPGLWGIHEIAETRITESGDEDAVVYVRNSILHPNDYIVPGDDAGPYPENLMPQNYGDLFTDEELNDVVAYVLSLGYE